MGELSVRFLVTQGFFFFGADWHWNLFDTVVVCGSISEVVVPAWRLNLSFVRLLRVLRILRTFRVLRFLRFASFLKDLRLMTLAIMKSIVPLIWASLFLVFILYFFAVLFLQAVVSHMQCNTEATETTQTFEALFHSLPMAVLTLWMSVSGGVNWWEVAKSLLDVSPWYCLIMVFFVIIMLVAVMNIMTGIFVNDALQMASLDRDLVEQQQSGLDQSNVEALQELFRQIDCDQTGKITIEELTEILERNDVRATFATVGLEVSNATSFFKLLDTDDSNSLEVEEFVVGCMRIRGMAKAVDLQTLMFENKRLMKRLKESQVAITGQMQGFRSSIDQIWHVLSGTEGEDCELLPSGPPPLREMSCSDDQSISSSEL